MTREEAIGILTMLICQDTRVEADEYEQALNMAIKALSQEPCDDAISRKAALEKMADYVASGYADSVEDFEEYSRIICQLPPVTQKSGKWDRSCTCSVCRQWRILESEKNGGKYKYCPNCGAKMESED